MVSAVDNRDNGKYKPEIERDNLEFRRFFVVKWPAPVYYYLGYRLEPLLLLRTRDKRDCILF